MGCAMRKAKRWGVPALLLLLLCRPAGGEEPWQVAFDQACSKSGESMTLSVDELRSLLDQCSALEKIIEKQEPSVRKVYLKRLQLCRNLYAYMLEYRIAAQQAR